MLIGKIARFTPTAAAALLLASLSHSAEAGGTLRIAMTASDVPTTTGVPLTTASRVCASWAIRSSRDWCCGICRAPTS